MRLNRTKGVVLWMRAHFEGRLRVEIRGSEAGGCIVLVRRGDEPMREIRLEPGVQGEAVRLAADEIVRGIFPHACADADCGEWVEMPAPRT